MIPRTMSSYDCDGKLLPTGVKMIKQDAAFGTDSPHSLTSREQ